MMTSLKAGHLLTAFNFYCGRDGNALIKFYHYMTIAVFKKKTKKKGKPKLMALLPTKYNLTTVYRSIDW